MIIFKYVFHRGKGWNIFGLCGKVSVERGNFCEKLLEGSPMPDEDNAR